MAFTPFTLAKAMNESTFGYVPSNVPAHKFAGDSVVDAIGEANNMIVTEAAGISEFITSANDMLAECAMTNNSRFEVLHENVFVNVKNKVVEFFKKIIAAIKGIIEKLKAAVYKMAGKTDKWLNIMRPKIKAAAAKPGAGEFTVEMYNYEAGEDYITTGLSDVFSKFQGDWQQDMNWTVGDKDKFAEAFKSWKTSTAARGDSEGGKTADEVQPLVDQCNAERDDYKKKLEDAKDAFPGKIAGYAGVSGGTSLESVESAIVEKARGKEKVQKKIGNRTDKMLQVIEKSKDTIEKIRKAYEDHMKTLEKVKAELEKSGSDIEIKTEDSNKATIPGELTSAVREAYTAKYKLMTDVTSMYEAELGKIRQLNITLVNSMASDYMTALSKFAGFKGTKAS